MFQTISPRRFNWIKKINQNKDLKEILETISKQSPRSEEKSIRWYDNFCTFEIYYVGERGAPLNGFNFRSNI